MKVKAFICKNQALLRKIYLSFKSYPKEKIIRVQGVRAHSFTKIRGVVRREYENGKEKPPLG